MNFKLRLVALLLVLIMCLSSCDIFGFINGSDTTTDPTTVTTTETPTTKPTTKKSTTSTSKTTKVTQPKLPTNDFDPSSSSTSKSQLEARYTLTAEEVDATKALLANMVEMSKTADNADAIDALFEEFETSFYHIAQQMTISMIIYYCDMIDEVASERYLGTQDMFYDLQDAYNQSLRTMYLESPIRDQLFEGWSEEEIQALLEYDPVILELKQEIDALQVEYDQLDQNDPAYNDACVELYKQIIIKSNKLAKLNKYDNYYDYASANVYGRDYEREQLAIFRENIVKHIVPYVEKVFADFNVYQSWESKTNLSRLIEFLEDAFYNTSSRNYVSAYLNSLEGTMGENMRHVFESKNCVFSFSGNSHPTAFQTYLYEDDTPICFFGSSGQSANTVIHEIGHYYAAKTNNDIDNYDLCETHSQGNEFLFLTYVETYMKPEVYDVVEAYNLVNTCYIMILATIIDEFEQRVYMLDDETIESMTGADFDAIMTSVCGPYGGAPWIKKTLSDPYAYWRLVAISNPVYYISYAISASAAVNIYAIAQEDYAAAITAYTALVEGVTAEDGFLGALAKAGLSNPFEEETFVNIAGVLSK